MSSKRTAKAKTECKVRADCKYLQTYPIHAKQQLPDQMLIVHGQVLGVLAIYRQILCFFQFQLPRNAHLKLQT